MIFNGDMTIWILAVGLLVSVALAGWRQGAIRAAFSLVGILFAYWLAEPVGGLFQPLLPILGVGNPILTWAIAPVIGFALVSAVFKFAAFFVHHRVEMYYKYKAGDLRLALWERLNSRLGICLGLVNGAAYFILVSFCLFNLSYATTQVAVAPNQPASIQWVNQLGQDLQATGVAKAATAVATLPPTYYKLADVTGLLMQNPQASQRLADYPALMSLYERDDIQALLQDSALTNALAGGTALGEILNNATVRGLLQNKELFSSVQGILESNLDDLSIFLATGKSPKYDGEKIIGRWEFNVNVTIAWLRQNQPKMPASEMRAARGWMTSAYAQTRLLAAGDHQLFVKNLPKLKPNPGAAAPTTELNNWKGDWKRTGTNYDLHITGAGGEKYLTATAEDLRLFIKDGKNLLIFDRSQ